MAIFDEFEDFFAVFAALIVKLVECLRGKQGGLPVSDAGQPRSSIMRTFTNEHSMHARNPRISVGKMSILPPPKPRNKEMHTVRHQRHANLNDAVHCLGFAARADTLSWQAVDDGDDGGHVQSVSVGPGKSQVWLSLQLAMLMVEVIRTAR